MKKQFAKIKIAAENLSRSNKQERKDFELETIEKQVEKYRDVLEKIVRKLPTTSGTSSDPQERDKRIKKSLHYKIGQSLDESSKELSKEMPLQRVLANCGDLEKSLAECIVDCELETETEVVRRLKNILDNEIQEISTLKRNVSRTIQEHTSLKRSYEAAIKLDEPQTKINSIKDQQEQCEVKLEKERDQWAAQMFELIAKEDVIVQCIRDYVLNQRNYHERALRKVNSSLASIQDVIQTTVKSRFGTSLTDHLDSSNREISYIIELCVCCLLEHGIYEEGLLRVGCASTKLRRMKHALEAQYVKTPLPVDYQDPYVIGAILKLYLRELPEPLMTYKYYKEFMHALDRDSEAERMQAIKMVLGKLPKANYVNLRYLTKFLWHITQNVDHNKMSSQNLAIVMSPNMLWPRVDKSNPAADYLGQMNSSSASNTIVELLISHWDYFFEGGDVEFFVTLQRNKLFMEGKSKSNSSSENLDKHGDGDMHDSPRYGTIRRQKANAPSPPTKAQTTTTSNGDGGGGNAANGEVYAYRNGEISRPHAKELFPSGTYQQTNERPEKPPLPKQLQLQQQQVQQQNQQQVQLQSVHQKQMQSQVNISNVQSQQQQQHNNQQSQDPTTPKPVPMTRTQFFGLDNLPSPVADRKSTDSSIFKPDLPLKPKIPKRPMVLGLNSANKSDDEGGTTPTPTQPTANTMLGGANLPEDSAGDSANKSRTNSIGSASGFGSGSNSDDNNGNELLKKSTEQLIEQLRQESLCDKMNASVGGGQSQPQQTSATNLNAAKELNQHNQRLLESEQQQQQATLKNTQPQLLQLQTQTQSQTQAQSQSQAQTQTHQRQPTPTTPISPNMFQAPKRPTVPAPPPPSIVKKQVE